ncbi:Palmitoyltransferase [Aphelenchoides besseyi]|nr:Palmitoyltransferase [Aphelenchoides besseyi]
MEYQERMNSVNHVVRETRRYANRLQPQDIISIGCMAIILPIGYLIQIFFILSFWYETFSDSWYLRVVPLTYMGLNIYLNLWMLIRVGSNGNSAPLPTVMKPGFRYCHSCQLNAPPRTYHCPVCDKCIFRRDHHCSFAATCVGHFNQRYFVAGIINLWIVLAICVCWNWSYIFMTLPRFYGLQMWQMMVPHVALFAGYLTVGQFFSVFFFVTSISALLFVTYLVVAQMFCIYRGQTRMEYLMDIFAYKMGFWENIRQSLGTRWPLIFISPFIPSPLPSDGLSFKTSFDSIDLSKSTKFL